MQSMKRNSNEITEGVIWKQLLAFFFPVLLGSLFQQLYNTVDTMIVGRFVGTEALAAVGGSSTQILNLIIGFFTAPICRSFIAAEAISSVLPAPVPCARSVLPPDMMIRCTAFA